MSPQGGGGGSGTAAGVFDSSLKGGGQVGRNGTLTPVTIKELRDAAQTSPEESTFQICGTPLAQVPTPKMHRLSIQLANFSAFLGATR